MTERCFYFSNDLTIIFFPHYFFPQDGSTINQVLPMIALLVDSIHKSIYMITSDPHCDDVKYLTRDAARSFGLASKQ